MINKKQQKLLNIFPDQISFINLSICAEQIESITTQANLESVYKSGCDLEGRACCFPKRIKTMINDLINENCTNLGKIFCDIKYFLSFKKLQVNSGFLDYVLFEQLQSNVIVFKK